MLPAVTALASELAYCTSATILAARRLIAYSAAFPDNALRYDASDMVLVMQTDASYLSRRDSQSVAGAVAYLTNTGTPDRINGALWAMSSIIPVVVSSAAEAEYAALFMGSQQAVWLRVILEEMGYPQLPTTVFCDNSCAVGIVNDTCKLKRTKSVDMRFHWVRDRVRQGQLIVTWAKGSSNLADFFTKPLSAKDHLVTMPFLVVSAAPPPKSKKRTSC
jgi:hypothetical protein